MCQPMRIHTHTCTQCWKLAPLIFFKSSKHFCNGAGKKIRPCAVICDRRSSDWMKCKYSFMPKNKERFSNFYLICISSITPATSVHSFIWTLARSYHKLTNEDLGLCWICHILILFSTNPVIVDLMILP